MLDIRRDGPVEYVTLNRPEVRNAFNEVLIAELTAWALGASGRDAPRVAVLGGAGKVFCAGADLTWMAKTVEYTRDENLRDAEALAAMLDALDRLPVPLVGRVHGAALGGGVGLAAVCDVVVAADDAVFGFTEVKLGILPAAIAPYAMAKIGASAARELFLTGARFGAERARAIGLVHTVVPPAELDAAVSATVGDLLAAGPQAVSAAKRLIADIGGRSPREAARVTTHAIATRRTSSEGQEGMRAFLEKRKPRWVEDRPEPRRDS